MPVVAESFLNEVFFSALEPRQHDLLVSQWAEEKRVLTSKEASEAGKFRISRTPYVREPMDKLSCSDPTNEIVLMWASQLGKTEIGNNFTGYGADYDPGAMLIVMPSLGLAKRHSKQRLQAMISSTPCLNEVFPDSGRRDSSNTVLEKTSTHGAMIILAGAEAASGLASTPIKRLMLDEIDRFPDDVEKEGDPIELAEARTRTFGRKKKILKTSTPVLEENSKIVMAYEKSSKGQFHVPCPHCKQKQVLVFSGKDNKYGLVWDKDEPETAQYVCKNCGAFIEERHKTWMLGNGEWVHLHPERKIKGYHLTSLYSPHGMMSWAEIAEKFIETKKNPMKLKTFVNTILAEPYSEKGEAPDYENLYRNREKYTIGTVPKEALFITAGVDIQKDRIEVLYQGWGAEAQRWAIDYDVLTGDTTQPEVWDALTKALDQQFLHELGGTMGVSKYAVDTGYNTQMVYNWLRAQDQSRAMGVKGNDNMPRLLGAPTNVDVITNGQTIYRGLSIWVIGVGHAKTELFGFLKKDPPLEDDAPYPYGWCHYPEFDLHFFKGLCSEKKIYKNNKPVWVKTYERNEPLDLSVYARAAVAAAGMDRWSEADWQALRNQQISLAQNIQRPSKQKDVLESYIQQDRESYIT